MYLYLVFNKSAYRSLLYIDIILFVKTIFDFNSFSSRISHVILCYNYITVNTFKPAFLNKSNYYFQAISILNQCLNLQELPDGAPSDIFDDTGCTVLEKEVFPKLEDFLKSKVKGV